MSISPAMKLVLDFSRLQTKMLKKIESQLGMHGLSFTEFLMMYQLNTATRHTMRRIDLAEGIGLSASGVTRLLAPMEKLGLIGKEANPRDARVSLVQLTDTGKKVFEEALVSFGHSADAFMQPIDDEQIGLFLKLTGKLL